ncbi:hypothetical protein ACLOJK_002012 [Asimina triloba]
MVGMKNERSKEGNGRRAGSRQSEVDRKTVRQAEPAAGQIGSLPATKMMAHLRRRRWRRLQPCSDEDDGAACLLQRRRWRRLPAPTKMMALPSALLR